MSPTRAGAPAYSSVAAACAGRAAVDLAWLEAEPLDDWALTAEALRFAARLVQLTSPTRIVELGSGRSTRVLARTVKEMSPVPSLTTLENDPDVAASTLAALERDGTADGVDLRLAPVVVRRCHGRQVPVYHLGEGVEPGPAEVILIDGPPDPLGGREGALYQAVGWGCEGAAIILDDAHRAGEERALERLDKALGDRIGIEVLDGFDKGLAVVSVHERTAVPMRIDAGHPRPDR